MSASTSRPIPNAIGTLEEAINKIKAMPAKPSFMIHTGDITHLSKVSEFDDADRIISQAKLDVHYVPGEHDIIDEEVKLYKRALRPRHQGRRLVFASTPAACISSASSTSPTSRAAASAVSATTSSNGWRTTSRAARHPRRSCVFAHIPLWTVYPQWGWGTEDGARALDYVKRFGSVTVLNGHIHQVMQKVEGNVTFHTARSTAFPQPAPGTAPSPGPMKVEDDKLRSLLGVASINFKQGEQRARDHRHAAAGLKRILAMHPINRRDFGIAVVAAMLLPVGAARAEDTLPMAVHIDNFVFEPAPAHGEGRHRPSPGPTATTSRTPWSAPASSGRRRMDTDGTFSFTFTAPGEYKYFCSLHPHMTGMVKVE